MIDISIRKAGVEDVRTIHDMAEVVFRHTYADILSSEQMEYMMDWMYSLPNLEEQLAQGHVYHLAFLDGRPCGYVSVQADGSEPDGTDVYHLHKIYVLPSEQGKGIGQMLFDTALSYVRKRSDGRKARVELNVNRNNPSIGFYIHNGMRVLRQDDFHIGNGFYMNDFIMGLDIDA